MIKPLQYLSIEGEHLNNVKAHCDKPTDSIVLNEAILKKHFQRDWRQKECSISPFLFNTLRQILARENKQEKGNSGTKCKREVKLSLPANDRII